MFLGPPNARRVRIKAPVTREMVKVKTSTARGVRQAASANCDRSWRQIIRHAGETYDRYKTGKKN